MTELIVALDGPRPEEAFKPLYDEAGVRWFKIGPQTLAAGCSLFLHSFLELMSPYHAKLRPYRPINLFLDLKLADTEDTCREAVRRFADAGVAAVSTFTNRATLAAMAGAEGSGLRVWRVTHLTDELLGASGTKGLLGHGVICPVIDLPRFNETPIADKVCPGIRRLIDDPHGHKLAQSPISAKNGGATHIVVGRPIWQADDPVAAAKEFLAELAP